MRFAYPQYLWFLLAIPGMLIYLAYFRPFDLPSFRFSSVKLLGDLTEDRSLKKNLFTLGILRCAAVVFLIVALARPQQGLRSEELTTKATDILVCLDASRSMLIMDFKPDNRFAVAKRVIKEFIKGREYDRLGLVVFAEFAVTLCPLTLDKSALLNILDQTEVGVVPPDRTAIGIGLATSVNRLKNSAAKSKVIILLTDGSNNAGNVDPITAAKTAAAFGIKIYTIGVGSAEGGLMPVDDPNLGRRLVQTRSDIDEELLDRIASETQGRYFRAKDPEALKTIFKEIDSLEKTDIKVKEYVDYRELYVGFLLAALALLLMELTLTKTVFRTLP